MIDTTVLGEYVSADLDQRDGLLQVSINDSVFLELFVNGNTNEERLRDAMDKLREAMGVVGSTLAISQYPGH